MASAYSVNHVCVVGESYRDLQHKLLAIVDGLQSVENGWQLLGVKFHVDDGT